MKWKREYWDLKYLKQVKDRYKEELKRVESLPADYQEIFQQIVSYLTVRYGGFDGLDLMNVQSDLIDLLEEAAAQKISAVELIGDDVESFAQEFGQVHDIPNWQETYMSKRQEKMNERVQRKLGGR